MNEGEGGRGEGRVSQCRQTVRLEGRKGSREKTERGVDNLGTTANDGDTAVPSI